MSARTRAWGASRARALVVLAAALWITVLNGCMPYTPSTAEYPSDWNPNQVAWRPYALGLREAGRARKPIVLVFYTDWCPHCHNFSRVFHDPRVVEASRGFVMIRVERDSNPELSQAYQLDGDYIPRTFFLMPDGDVLEKLDSGRSEFRYFLDEDEPDELLALMQRAAKLAAPAP